MAIKAVFKICTHCAGMFTSWKVKCCDDMQPEQQLARATE